MSGERMLGNTCRDRTLRVGVPMVRDASMNVSSRTVRAWPRTRRVKPGIMTTPMATMALVVPGPSTDTSAMARTSAGIAIMASMNRMKMLSNSPLR